MNCFTACLFYVQKEDGNALCGDSATSKALLQYAAKFPPDGANDWDCPFRRSLELLNELDLDPHGTARLRWIFENWAIPETFGTAD